jgi:DNA polymerase-3 subunit epsilon
MKAGLLNFVCLDIETANADLASICQIGIAKFIDGDLTDEWSSLINPEDDFDPINISIHGISEEDVADAPKFPEVYSKLANFLISSICVSHTHFDRVSLTRAERKYGLIPIVTTWLDSATVARRTWLECASSGYGLAPVCKIIGYTFKHHDALEDAKAAGQVVLSAMARTGLDLDHWLVRVNQPIEGISREGNPEGAFYGEVLVFTGTLQIPRREAASLAASTGCSVANGVTAKTTLLVVGDQDITKLAGKSKSSKHIKAEQLVMKGQNIRIMKESDFRELVSSTQKVNDGISS